MPITKKTVIVSYHFFAHYRKSVLTKLNGSKKYNFLFAGDIRDPGDGTIQAYNPETGLSMIRLRCRNFAGILWQPGAVRLPFYRDIRAVIFLGNMYMPWTWLAAVICRMRRVRVIFWTHGWRRPDGIVKSALRRTFYRLADALLVYEHAAKAIAIKQGFDPDTIHVVYNSLNTEEQEHAAEKATALDVNDLRIQIFQNSNPTVICVTRLVTSKRVDLAIRAVKKLALANHLVNLIIVGEGPDRSRLEKMANAANISTFFAGECYDEMALAKLFRASTVAVSPGPVGLMVIHGFAYGVPIIASDRWEIQGPEWGTIVPKENGDFFVHDDVNSLANTLRAWTMQSKVPEETAQKCREIIKTAYNSTYQRKVIEHAVDGEPANDLLRTYDKTNSRETEQNARRC